MTDKTVKINKKQMQTSKTYGFIGHGITCQCMKKQLCLNKQVYYTQSFFKRLHLYVP